MKQSEVHQNLSDENLREWLAQEWSRATTEGGYGEDHLRHYEQKIEELKRKIEACKRFAAVETVLKMKGWEWFDVSDDVSDYSEQTFYGFVGTEEERASRFD